MRFNRIPVNDNSPKQAAYSQPESTIVILNTEQTFLWGGSPTEGYEDDGTIINW